MKQMGKAIIATVVLTLAHLSGLAAVVTLDFEGLQNNERVENFFNGGTGSQSSSKGYNYGISFTTNVLAYKGTLNQIVSPTPTYMFLEKIQDPDKDPKGPYVMNVAPGFTSLAFEYSTALMPEDAFIRVYSGLDGTGTELLAFKISPTLSYDTWMSVNQTLEGVAKSVVFTDVQGYPCITDLTIDLDPPSVTAVPEPSTWLAGVGCLLPLLGFTLRQRRKQNK